MHDPNATSCRLPTRYKLPVKEVFCAFLQEGVPPNRDFALRRMTVTKLSDTVDLILKQKGRDIWSVSPDQSVYEAIKKRWQTREWGH
ncbi:MAG: hypothetical protein JWN92_1487 [Candidatus Acidoferrum typicum]|nr:hypothetical protein [Candidatus Acidoferrum typicum]